MNGNLIGFALVTFLHDLFTVVWIGGLMALSVTVLPSAKQVLGAGPQIKQLMQTIQKRQSLLVYVSIVGLLVTGLLQARRNPAFEGLFAFGTAYSLALSLKHILVLAMIGITLYRSLVLGRGQPLTPAQERLNGRLLLTNAILGGIVLLFSGIITALSTGAPV
ncbi:MAG TPA: hypothetical protein VJ793_08525 [Anaerolineae bacterium]|nr:hypothetical protein [Anaerolineae bacterium]